MATNFFQNLAPVEPGPRKGRIAFVSTVLALCFGGLVARAGYLQLTRHEHYMERSERQHRTTVLLHGSRGDIRDRNGEALVQTAPAASVVAEPRLIKDPDTTFSSLSQVLDLSAPLRERLERRDIEAVWKSGQVKAFSAPSQIMDLPVSVKDELSKKEASFVWVARQISPTRAQQVRALNLPGIRMEYEPHRHYPNRAIAGPLLGFVDLDGRGIQGMELDYDKYLKGRTYPIEALRDARRRVAIPGGSVPVEQLAGHSIVTTLDLRIQQVAETALTNQVREMEAKSGVVVVVEPETGDILAMAQTPGFDPNAFRTAEPEHRRNRAITDVLEPGSTIKPILVSAALDLGKIEATTRFQGFGGTYKVGRKLVKDTHAMEEMTTLEIIQHSSNVGAVQVGQRIGKEAYYNYLRAYGFGEPTGIGLSGEVGGQVRPVKRWGLVHLGTFSYGYGLSVTPLQMAMAIATIANGGRLMKPRLVMEVLDARDRVVESFPPEEVRRVVKPEAAAIVTQAMVLVTTDGTGKKARVPGFVVAGKTGTAHKVDAGGYSKKKVRSSFVGFVPAAKPRLVIYVAIDEPEVAQYGGTVAAPVFAAIAREALPYLGVQATEPIVEGELDQQAAAPVEEDVAEGIAPQAQSWWFADGAIITGGKTGIQIPELRGKSISQVISKAAELGVRLEIQGAGLVTAQRPAAGGLLPKDGVLAVELTLPGELTGEEP